MLGREGGRVGGVQRKICTTMSSLVLELLNFIIDIDDYGLLNCACLLTMKCTILVLFETIKSCLLVILSVAKLFLMRAYKVNNLK